MNKKLHILFLSSWYPSRIFPTNGDFVQRHAETIATKHKLTLIHVVTDNNLKKNIVIEDKIINNVRTIIAYIPQKNNFIKFFFFLKTYLKLIDKIETFDLIHLNVTYPKGLIGLYLKLVKKKKYIITEHWTGYLYPLNNSINFIKKTFIKYIIKNAEFVCPVSENLKKDMIKFGLKGTYKTIPNVIDTSIFKPNDVIVKTFTITNISNLNNQQKNIKGILNVIEKLSQIRSDFVLKIIGNGDKSEIENYIKSLNIPNNNIKLLGEKSQKEIAEILQHTSIYVSFSNYESFGLVMTEAIAVGTPVISTNTGILTEINAKNFTSIIPIGDEDALLKKILEYMDINKIYNKKKMHDLIKNNYSKTIICNEFTKLYGNILELKID